MNTRVLISTAIALLASTANAVEPKLSISETHMLLLKTDGTVWAWGSSAYGKLGTGGSSSGTPAQVQGLTGVVDIITRGSGYSMALKADGTVWVWGNVSSGQSSECTGCGGQFKDFPHKVPAVQQMVSIATTFPGYTALSVGFDGRVWAWGEGSSGELGDGLQADRASPQPVAGLSNVVSVSASNQAVLALRSDGSLVGWGYNGSGSTSDHMLAGHTGANIIAPTVLNVPAVSFAEATQSNTSGQFFGINANAHPIVWGDTNSGLITCHQVAGGTSILQPYAPTGLTNITQIAGGSLYALFLTSSGSVLGCGYNSDAQLGDGTTVSTTQSSSPAKVGPVVTAGLPTNILSVAAGVYASGALDISGNVYTWGKAGGSYLSGQGDESLPANNLSAVKLSINAGAAATAPAIYAGTQSGPASNVTVDAGLAVAPAHRGQIGQIYLVVVLPNGSLLILDSTASFVPFDATQPLPSIYSGELPRVVPLNLARDTNLSSLVGTSVIIGYGLGTGAAADQDLLDNLRYQNVMQLLP